MPYSRVAWSETCTGPQQARLVYVNYLPRHAFVDIPFLERLPSAWIPAEAFPAVLARMQRPDLYCPQAILGTFVTELEYTNLRFLPCLEPTAGRMCQLHAAEVPPPVPPQPQPVRIVRVATPPARERHRAPAPKPVPKPSTRPLVPAALLQPPPPPLSGLAKEICEHRQREIKLEQVGVEHRDYIDASFHVNHRGEWVIGGRVFAARLADVIDAV